MRKFYIIRYQTLRCLETPFKNLTLISTVNPADPDSAIRYAPNESAFRMILIGFGQDSWSLNSTSRTTRLSLKLTFKICSIVYWMNVSIQKPSSISSLDIYTPVMSQAIFFFWFQFGFVASRKSPFVYHFSGTCHSNLLRKLVLVDD